MNNYNNGSATEILTIIESAGINLNYNNGRKQERINKVKRSADLRSILSSKLRGQMPGVLINAQTKKAMNKDIIDTIDNFDETKNYFPNPLEGVNLNNLAEGGKHRTRRAHRKSHKTHRKTYRKTYRRHRK
jgi:hypothetical protein